VTVIYGARIAVTAQRRPVVFTAARKDKEKDQCKMQINVVCVDVELLSVV